MIKSNIMNVVVEPPSPRRGEEVFLCPKGELDEPKAIC
jgi:hypothetical protein